MLNKQQIPSRSQQQLIAAAVLFTEDVNEGLANDLSDHIDVNLYALNLRWMLASRREN